MQIVFLLGSLSVPPMHISYKDEENPRLLIRMGKRNM